MCFKTYYFKMKCKTIWSWSLYPYSPTASDSSLQQVLGRRRWSCLWSGSTSWRRGWGRSVQYIATIPALLLLFADLRCHSSLFVNFSLVPSPPSDPPTTHSHSPWPRSLFAQMPCPPTITRLIKLYIFSTHYTSSSF